MNQNRRSRQTGMTGHDQPEYPDELDLDKLTPLLRLKYNNAIADGVADLGGTAQIRTMFAGFQKYLYESPSS